MAFKKHEDVKDGGKEKPPVGEDPKLAKKRGQFVMNLRAKKAAAKSAKK